MPVTLGQEWCLTVILVCLFLITSKFKLVSLEAFHMFIVYLLPWWIVIFLTSQCKLLCILDLDIYPLVHACSLSRVRLFGTPWTVAHQAPLFVWLSRQEYWSGSAFPPPGDLPNAGIEPVSPASPALASRFFTTEPAGKPYFVMYVWMISFGLILAFSCVIGPSVYMKVWMDVVKFFRYFLNSFCFMFCVGKPFLLKDYKNILLHLCNTVVFYRLYG